MPEIVTPDPIILSDGSTATVRQAKGRDSVKAARVLPPADQSNPMAMSLALLAQVTLIAGQPVTYEELGERLMTDISKLTEAMGSAGNGLPASALPN